jgi:lipopolysaccharide/colanic/teichoic acid biosynthesis glycosyltransferase
MKRLFDIVVTLAGLIVAAPFIFAISAIIKLESKGPILYRCNRVGRSGRPFGMLKFRTMLVNADDVNCKICGVGDVRVTSFGRFLRRTKLNELPQLFNVLLGHMSAVGPRPEDPKFTNDYRDQWQVVLSVRPGIVGPSQILNRNEEDLFPPGEDRERFYTEHILPEKLKRDMEYVNHHTFWGDLLILFKAVYVTIFKGFSFRQLFSRPQLLKLMALDAALSLVAYLIANLAKYETIPVDTYVLWSFIFVVAANPIICLVMGLYRRSLRFFSLPDLLPIIRMSLVCGMSLMVMNYFFLIGSGQARSVYFLYPIFLMLFIAGTRVMARVFLEKGERMNHQGALRERLLIYGAGRLGIHALQRFRFEPDVEVVGFVDDDPNLKGRSVLGVPVLGSGCDLSFIRSLHGVEKVFFAFKPSSPGAATNARRQCLEAGVMEFVSQISESNGSDNGSVASGEFRYFTFIDTLDIKPVSLDSDQVAPLVEGSTIALVGPGDRFGEELCLELVNLKVRGLVLLEDCGARLERIVSFLHSIHKDNVAVSPYFLPLASHSLIERTLAGQNLNWIIYNRPNRPIVPASVSQPALTFTDFAEAAGFVEMSKRLGCNGFSFLSPFGNDSFSDDEKKLHLLAEIYVRLSARYEETQTRFGVVRLPNILENENGIFVRSCNRISRGVGVSEPSQPLAFASARNAARMCLNSLPLHDKGETFVANSSVYNKLGSLIDQFFRFQGDERSLDHLIHASECTNFSQDAEHATGPKTCIETGCPCLLKADKELEADKHLVNLLGEMSYFFESSRYGLELPRILSVLKGRDDA